MNGNAPISVARSPSARPTVLLSLTGCPLSRARESFGALVGSTAITRACGEELHRRRDSGAQTTAADGNENGIDVRNHRTYLESNGSLPRDYCRIIIWMNQRHSFGITDLARSFGPFLGSGSSKHD